MCADNDKWSWVTPEMFEEAVHDLARDAGWGYILGLPGVWEILAEDLNNDALEKCAEDACRCCECGGLLNSDGICQPCDGNDEDSSDDVTEDEMQ
jgi:hypothetical protein